MKLIFNIGLGFRQGAVAGGSAVFSTEPPNPTPHDPPDPNPPDGHSPDQAGTELLRLAGMETGNALATHRPQAAG